MGADNVEAVPLIVMIPEQVCDEAESLMASTPHRTNSPILHAPAPVPLNL